MGPVDAPSVSVIGDSLVYQAEGSDSSGAPTRKLADELVVAGYRAHVSGWIGETLDAGHEQLWPAVAAEPDLDVLVIALGTNDINQDIPLETSRVALRRWLAETDYVGCVVLVGVNELAYAWELDVHGPAFNAMLSEEAAARPNAIFVRFDPIVDPDTYDGDVHFPTEDRQAEYRSTIRGAVESFSDRIETADER